MKTLPKRQIGFSSVFAVAVVGLIVFVALAADFISPYLPMALSREILVAPNQEHLLGTDGLGRDVLSGIFHGARTSLSIGLLAAAAATLVGTVIGAYAGFRGGVIDLAVMRVAEMFQVFPAMILAALVIAMLGASFTNVVLVIVLLAWPQTARIARNEAMRIKEMDFVHAARTLGHRRIRVLLFEVVPNLLSPVIALGTLIVGEAILLEASLSFLGLGAQGTASWGRMLNEGWQVIFRGWWLSVFPGLAIFLTILAMNLLGDTFNRHRER